MKNSCECYKRNKCNCDKQLNKCKKNKCNCDCHLYKIQIECMCDECQCNCHWFLQSDNKEYLSYVPVVINPLK